MSDLYARLGIDKGAGTDEIRRAFKDKARISHPDKGGDVEEFKRVQEAHEVLCDPERRRMYDLTGSVNGGGGGGGMPNGGMAAGGIPFHFMSGMGPFGMPGVSFDMGDMFGNIFGGGGPRKPARRGGRGPDKHHDIGLTLTDFYRGKEIKLKFNQARKCEGCKGSGAETTESCGPCSGSGMRTVTRPIGPGMMAQTRMPCDACNGDGLRIIRACRVCQGKKFTEKENQLDIKIIPGMVEGERLVYVGECSDTAEFDIPGDVVLTLRRADGSDTELDTLEWRGEDLWIRKLVTYSESVLGFRKTLENHPGGAAPTVVWRGGPLLHGAVLQLSGLGMPRKGGGYGNLFVQVMVEPPPTRAWTAEEAATLQSVLGGVAATMDGNEVQTLQISSAASRLIVDRSPSS